MDETMAECVLFKDFLIPDIKKKKKYYVCVCVFVCGQVSTAAAPDTQSHAETFTIGVLPQDPGFPQLAPDCDLQITVRDDHIGKSVFSTIGFVVSRRSENEM